MPATQYYGIASPIGISTTTGLSLDNSSIVPYGSWAKCHYHRDSYDPSTPWLIFSFFYQNTSGADMVITCGALIELIGLAQADDDTGFWLVDHEATTVSLSTWLSVYDWPVQNPLTDPHVQSFSEVPLSLNAYGPGWPECVGAILIQNVLRGYFLEIEDIIVKAGSAKVFDVVVSFQSSVGDGVVDVDFSSGNFQVIAPLLQIDITS
jgi:hypothetical protein